MSEIDTTKTDTKMEEKEVILTEEQFLEVKRKLERALINLFLDEPFYAGASMGITKKIDGTCKTAYVGVNRKRLTEIVMGFSPSFLLDLNEQRVRGLITHEVLHVLFHHIFDRVPADYDKRVLWNIACDCAINSIIGKDNLPTAGIIPGVRPLNCKDEKLADLIEQFPQLESSDYYYEKLNEFAESQGEGGQKKYTFTFGDQMDDHDGWGELPDELKEALRQEVRDMVRNGVKLVHEKNDKWGSVPLSLQEQIMKYLTREVNWKDIVRQFIGNIRTVERSSTIKRLNKKVPWVFPGVKRKSTARLLFAIDQSGSMGDEEVQKAFAEIWNCSQETEVDVINWDTEVDEESFRTWKRNKKHDWVRTKSGGTDVSCVADFANKNRGKYSGVIIFTDGYTPALPQINGSKVLWLITENGSVGAVREGDLLVQMNGNVTPPSLG